MLFEKITKKNFLILAMKFYDNNQCFTLQEFEEDLNRFQHIKKLMNRYVNRGDLKEHLIINHLIILFNLFGVATVDFLFYKIDKEYWGILATFLIFLNRMPDELPGRDLRLSDLTLDQHIIEQLRKL